VPHKVDLNNVEEEDEFDGMFKDSSDEEHQKIDDGYTHEKHTIELFEEEAVNLSNTGVPPHIIDPEDPIDTSRFGLDGDEETLTRIQLQKELGFVKADDVSINEVLAQIEYQLKDSTSPLMSNFMYLVDYQDGSELPDFEHFEDQHNFPELEQKLKSVFLQGEKLNSLISDITKMKSGLNDVKSRMKHMSDDMENRFSAAAQFDKMPKDERIKVAFNEKVNEMYSNYKKLGTK